MAELPVVEHPDPRLRTAAETVTTFDADLARFIDDMIETLRAHQVIGLSAQQVGDRRRVCIIDPEGDGSSLEVFVNPEIMARWRTAIVEESCLSIPGIQGNVFRATRLRLRAQDASGATFIRDLNDMHAVALQHELDHLGGKLFIDRLNPIRRLAIGLRTRAKARQSDGDQHEAA